MIIMEFKYAGLRQEESSTTTFNEESELMKFCVEKSIKHASFEITNLNKYVRGSLVPCVIAVDKGRIYLKGAPLREMLK